MKLLLVVLDQLILLVELEIMDAMLVDFYYY